MVVEMTDSARAGWAEYLKEARPSPLRLARATSTIATAQEKLTEAIEQLQKIEDVKTTAGSIHKSASKIETSCTAIYSVINLLLAAAQAALAEVR